MSNTLAQLRALFDDELFLRHRTGLTPTLRAQQLADPISQGLKLLESALSEPQFDPTRSERRFVIMASDYVELVLLPPLLRRLARQAPGVRLELRPWGLHEAPPELARGEADLMLGFVENYRASWSTVSGNLSLTKRDGKVELRSVFADNNNPWCGDHASNSPEVVQGIFFSNRPVELPEGGVSVMHIAPTVLDRLGVPVPADYDMAPLREEGR